MGTGAVLGPQVVMAPQRCRCGTRLPVGASSWTFLEPPDAVVALLSSQAFCSAVCARAYLLEALELLEEASAASVVRDAGAVASALAKLYARVTSPAS